MLPDVIEILPLSTPPRATITVPGSKSITNRALILAALAHGEVTLRGALWSEDTEAMFNCLRRLGFAISQSPDPDEPCNRTLTVQGLGGRIPLSGPAEQPLELFVANAGTAARFLAALVCLGHGSFRLSGVPRMHERPQAALFQALRALGYQVISESGNDRLPVIIHGQGPRPGRCQVSVADSSQFASALLLSAACGGWQVDIAGDNADELPYVAMTTQLVARFPQSGGTFQIEPDTSSGSYFVAAGELFRRGGVPPVNVHAWPTSDWQIDSQFPRVLPLPPRISRIARPGTDLPELGDSIMTGIVLAPFAPQPCEFLDLGRLRLQECERVQALRTELTKCGAQITETGDTLTVRPSALHGAEIETYHDHRMAMCFATLGLVVPGMRIKNPACVKKTFPNFFQKLAAPAPHGLGAEIWAVENHQRTRRLASPELFAD